MSKKSNSKFQYYTDKFFKRITRKKAKEELEYEFKGYVKKKQKELHRPLSREEQLDLKKDFYKANRRRIVEDVAKKARRQAATMAVVATIGIAGVGGYGLGLNQASVPGVTVDSQTGDTEVDVDELDGDLYINDISSNENEEENSHDVFIKQLQDSAINEEVANAEDLQNAVSQKVSSLDSYDEVMDYLEQLFVDEYNKSNDQEIDVDDVSLNVNVPSVRSL